MPQIVIDQERCNHCGACVALCNSGNVYAQENATYAAYKIILAAQRMGLGNCLIGYFIYALENSGDVAGYVAQTNAPIDAEIGQKDHLWMETS